MKRSICLLGVLLALGVAHLTAQNTFPATGNVGIGTTTPGWALEIGDSGELRIDGPSSATGTALSIGGYGNFSIDALGISGGRFIVNHSGNVGIGVPGPQYPLEVNGSIKLDAGSLIFPDGTSLNSSSLTVRGAQSGLVVSAANLGAYSGNGSTTQTSALPTTGNLLLGWNLSDSGGEQDLIANRGSGIVGGFRFYDEDNSGNMTSLLTLLGTGNVGIGTTNPQEKLELNGNLRFAADGTVQKTAWTGVLCGGDYAEAMNAAGGKKGYEPGDVLVLTDGDDSDVGKSAEVYSTMVAGVFATKPGVIGKREALAKSTEDIPMAMIGVVPTKVSAENGAIRKGDLLVTASISGYAMKGTDRGRMFGAVIGKAMGSLQTGTGVIEVLVTLQ